MRELLLVANPSASGFTGAALRAVTAALSNDFRVTTTWPRTPDESREEAADAARRGLYAVLAMGGDGAVHHVAQGLVHSDTALGVIPAGTTNVLARILGLPGKPRQAAAAMHTLEPRPLTLAHVSTESAAAARSAYAVFALGIGYDADVVESAERSPQSKYSFGSLHYARSAAAQIFGRYRNRPANLRVECLETRVDAVAVMVQVHHVYTYFGRVPLYLGKKPRPGLLACAIERMTVPTAARLMEHAVVRRSLRKAPGCHLFGEFDKLIIDADPATPFQADGELLGSASAFDVTPARDALQVLAPPA